jgi:hypothetical protein
LKARQHNNQKKKDKKSLKGIFKLFLSFLFWLLCCLAFKLRLLIAPLASSSFFCPFSFGYCEKDKKSLKMPKGAIRSRNLKARQHNNRKKKDKKTWKMPKG